MQANDASGAPRDGGVALKDASPDGYLRIGSGDSGPPTPIATGLTNPIGLTVAGDHLYWIAGENCDGGAIVSIPVTGGTPSTVYSSAHLRGGLTSDGAQLYFTIDDDTPDAGMDLDAILLDGGQLQALASGLQVIGTTSAQPNTLFFYGGAVFMAASTLTDPVTAVYSVPSSGGAPMRLTDTPWAAGPETREVSELLWVDSTGVYFSYQPPDSGGGYAFGVTPLDGGVVTNLGAEPQGTGGGGAGWTGNFVVVGGDAYFLRAATASPVWDAGTALMKIVLPSGPIQVVRPYDTEQALLGAVALLGDGHGLCEIQAQGGGAGVYAIDPITGDQTLMAGDTSIGAPYAVENIASPAAVDAKNIYFTEVTSAGYSIWALPR